MAKDRIILAWALANLHYLCAYLLAIWVSQVVLTLGTGKDREVGTSLPWRGCPGRYGGCSGKGR